MPWLGDTLDALAGAAVVASVIGGGLMWTVKVLKAYIKDQITEATKQIHPNANGGQSLNDVVNIARSTEHKVDTLAVRFDDHIAYHTGKEPK